MALKILHTDKRNDCGEILTKITQIVEEGKLRPLLDSKSFTFDEVAQAHEYLESNKAIGKIVLKTFGNFHFIIQILLKNNRGIALSGHIFLKRYHNAKSFLPLQQVK